MTVLKISIGQDVCFKGAQMVSIDSPILLCEQFNCKFVCYDLKPGVASGSMVAMPTDQRRNGLEVLMNLSRDLVLPDKVTPPDGKTLRSDQMLYNDILDLLALMKVGWNPTVVKTTGEKFVKALSNALWILDPHHKSFADRSVLIPPEFQAFHGYNDWQKKTLN